MCDLIHFYLLRSLRHCFRLKALKNQLGGELPQILTFGFGYTMDSELLVDITSLGTLIFYLFFRSEVFGFLCL